MPQTTIENDFSSVVVPGQLMAASDPQYFYSGATAAEVIPPGRACEIVPGTEADVVPKVRLCQGTGGPIAQFAGISVYRNYKAVPASGAATPANYAIGEMVVLLRKGDIAMEAVGTAPSLFGAVRISHSSTLATDRGKATVAAASATAGSEVSNDTAVCIRHGFAPAPDAQVVAVVSLG